MATRMTLYTGSAAKSSSFVLYSFYTDATMEASSKLEMCQLNEIDRIMLSSMKRSGRQCWWWARLTAARKISNQLLDDSRHHVQVALEVFWCWHVHNFEIFVVDNVCIHDDYFQKVHKHSYPPPPRLAVDCIMVISTAPIFLF